ncbi:hypothetical protein RI845_04165 [Thalassotalea nanhaiensis]|uniref:BIG2 domain-containing protein n=1 Tax=Thalassotalea nanhaiensis TaxID=3065648 RepID=A0ABY9TKK0_9GAMM|nr:hypothetical protein RI845_04165 [Colwelliaceae bacterium SQ345]
MLRAPLIFTGLTLMLCSCVQQQQQPKTETNIKVVLPNIKPADFEPEMDKIAIKEVEIADESTLPPSSNPPKDSDALNSKSNHSGFTVNQEICRNSSVTYKVADESGYINTHTAKAQAQATVIKVNNKQIKLMISGWYSRDKNLFNWQPYLKQQPVMGLMKLEKGNVYWDDKANWYLCSFNAGEMI